jgi:two-component system chemotaxis response regulator CheB
VTRILIVDDSPMTRRMFRQILSAEEGLEVIAEAPDPFVARDLIVQHEPDVVVLDIEMPRMDGLTFLKRLMKHHPMPVVIASSLTVKGGETALEAIRAGAVEVVCKPATGYAPAEVAVALVRAVRSAAAARRGAAGTEVEGDEAHVRARVASAGLEFRGVAGRKLVAIGASTGGTVAIERILRAIPAGFPPMVIAQHMPPTFTKAFARRLSGMSAVEVREAVEGDVLVPGLVLVAPGGMHLLVHQGPGHYLANVKDGPLVNGHRPSVDVLFRSVARVAGADGLGVILTGMGGDGAKGLLDMRQAGAFTIGQDEPSCVVYGMPAVAVELGAVGEVVPLDRIAHRMTSVLEGKAG